MDLLEKIKNKELKDTGIIKKINISGTINNYKVYAIPLDFLYYNDQNGRINTTYKKYKTNNEALVPTIGDSKYNEIFEKFIYESNKVALENTMNSIEEKTQQEPGVVLSDGRIIDGNRRFTALRKNAKKTGIVKDFEAVVLDLDVNSKANEKTIKELELDLQLGREERVNYDPIDRIFDVYNTIEVEKLMTTDEYKKASGAGSVKGIKRDIRLAKLILRFIDIVSPSEEGDNVSATDKFYLARDLKLDGPIEEIEGTINSLKNENKEAIIDAILVNLLVSKTDDENKDSTRVMRELKLNVINKPKILKRYLDAMDDKVDVVMEKFEDNPIKSSNDIKLFIENDNELDLITKKIKKSTSRLINSSKEENERRQIIKELNDVYNILTRINPDDFSDLAPDEILEGRELLGEITDALYKLKKDVNK